MRVPYGWLKEHVELDVPPEELADALTMAGVAVDAIERPGEEVGGVLVGEIVRLHPHPDADRLMVCEVRVGARTVQVVSGAPNLREGARVPVALPGARLPGGQIERTVIRGQKSEAMVCSAEELGFFDDRPKEEAGVLILPADAPIGEDVMSYLGMDDAVLVLDLTPNRADCMSISGLAREVAAIFDRRVKAVPPEPAEDPGLAATSDKVQVVIEDPDLCPRYSARLVTGVKVGQSPLWLQARLRAAGMRPINNIVDITNYVMLEYGQPLHAFDFDRLAEGRIIVRRARDGERIVTLDGQERQLDSDMLVIADPSGPVAVAGVMGGMDSEVREDTVKVLLESAHFEGRSVRRTSRRLGVPSEAAARFDRGVDPKGTVRALDRAAELLVKYAGGRVHPGVVDVYPRRVEDVVVTLRVSRINEVLGTDLDAELVRGLLSRLGFGVAAVGDDAEVVVTVPTRRKDISSEIDLTEEVARLYGYNNIEATLPRGVTTAGGRTETQLLVERAGRLVRGMGYDELVTVAYHSTGVFDRLRLPAEHPWRDAIRIANPMSEEQECLRTSLLPSLLEVLSYNARHQATDLQVYEINPVYLPSPGDLPAEDLHLVAAVMGSFGAVQWDAPARAGDFYDLKGLLEALLEGLGYPAVELRRPEGGEYPFLHPGRSAAVVMGGDVLGYLGELHPDVVEEYDLVGRPCVMEIDFSRLIAADRPAIRFRPLPRHPASDRDLAVIVDKSVPAAEVLRLVREAAGEVLEDCVLFDVYEGAPIPEGKKSLAVSMTFRSLTGTLTDERVQEVEEEIMAALRKELGAERRG